MNKAAVKISDPRGFKRICMNCGARFYDMNKRPIICPSCDTEFNNEMKLKGRKSRASTAQEEAEGQVTKKTSKEANGDDEDEIEEEPEDTEIVSLDDLETAETTDDDDALNVDRSALSRRHRKFVKPVQISKKVLLMRPHIKRRCRMRLKWSSISSMSAILMCWYTVSRNVTTWWNISANSLKVLRFRNMVGCSPMVRVA